MRKTAAFFFKSNNLLREEITSIAGHPGGLLFKHQCDLCCQRLHARTRGEAKRPDTSTAPAHHVSPVPPNGGGEQFPECLPEPKTGCKDGRVWSLTHHQPPSPTHIRLAGILLGDVRTLLHCTLATLSRLKFPRGQPSLSGLRPIPANGSQVQTSHAGISSTADCCEKHHLPSHTNPSPASMDGIYVCPRLILHQTYPALLTALSEAALPVVTILQGTRSAETRGKWLQSIPTNSPQRSHFHSRALAREPWRAPAWTLTAFWTLSAPPSTLTASWTKDASLKHFKTNSPSLGH